MADKKRPSMQRMVDRLRELSAAEPMTRPPVEVSARDYFAERAQRADFEAFDQIMARQRSGSLKGKIWLADDFDGPTDL